MICKKCNNIFTEKVNNTKNKKLYKDLCIPCRLKVKNKLYNYKKFNSTTDYKLTSWIANILSNHRQRFVVDIDTYELAEKWKDVKYCNICGIHLDWSCGKGIMQNNSPSIDRINNEKIMNINNVQLVCSQCNRIKSSNTMTKFIKSCKRIVDYNKNINYNIKGTQVRFC